MINLYSLLQVRKQKMCKTYLVRNDMDANEHERLYIVQYSQRHIIINHCDRRITLLSDTDTVQSETYHYKSL